MLRTSLCRKDPATLPPNLTNCENVNQVQEDEEVEKYSTTGRTSNLSLSVNFQNLQLKEGHTLH